MSFDFYAKDGRPLDFASWAELSGMPAYKMVASTEIGSYLVNTVWLGLSFLNEEPPLIFETIVFSGSSDMPHTQTRTATEAEARQFHDDMCNVIRATLMEAG